MVGVGTGDVDMDVCHNKFCSFLGRDCNSWGLSYRHHGIFTPVLDGRLDQGSIIGVQLDMWNGQLSFYKNRRLLGERPRLSTAAAASANEKAVRMIFIQINNVVIPIVLC